MPNIERFTRGTSNLPGEPPLVSRATQRSLENIQSRTFVRMARVQAEGMVTKEKEREIDHVTREAMVGQTMLRHWVHVLAHGDPILADELDGFATIAKMGKLQVLTDMVDTYCREANGL